MLVSDLIIHCFFRFTSTAPLTPVPLKVNIPIAWKLPEDYSQYFSTQPPKTTPKYPTKPINGYMEYVKENYKSFKDKTPSNFKSI